MILGQRRKCLVHVEFPTVFAVRSFLTNAGILVALPGGAKPSHWVVALVTAN